MKIVCALGFALAALALVPRPAAAATVTFVAGPEAIPAASHLLDFEALPLGETGLVYADVPGTLPVRLSGHEIGDSWIPTPFTVAGGDANHYVSLVGWTSLFLEFAQPLTYLGVGGVGGANVEAFFEFYTDGGLIPVAEFGPETASVYANFFAAPGTTFDYVRIVALNPATFDNLRFATVPLPGAAGLFAVAVLGLGGFGRRRRVA